MDNRYSDQPDGLPGNDDFGTLSAWFTFSALGIYPVTGESYYYLGSPLFSSATMKLPGGKVFNPIAISKYLRQNLILSLFSAVDFSIHSFSFSYHFFSFRICTS